LAIVPKYESSTTILVSGGKLMTGSVRSMIPGVTAQEEISAIKKYILSGQCIIGLINSLELKMTGEIKKQAIDLSSRLPEMQVNEIETMLFIEKVRKEIKVENQGRDIINLSAVHENPQKAYLMTKNLAQIFQEEFQKRQVGGIRGVREFSEEQLAIFRQKMDESEELLRRFKEGLLTNEIDTESDNNTVERMKSDITSMEVSMGDKQARMQVLANSLSDYGFGPDRIETRGSILLVRKMYQKVDELIAVLSQFTWSDPQVIELNDDINDFRDKIRVEIDDYINAVYSEKNQIARSLLVEWNMTDLDEKILNYERKGLVAKLTERNRNLTQLPTRELTLHKLEREVEQNREMYLKFLKQSQGTQIEEQIQRRDAEFKLQVIEQAQKPLYPINAGIKLKLMLLTLPFAGLALGGGLIIGLNMLDHSVKDVDDFEKVFGIKVWGIIPEIDDQKASPWVSFMVTTLIVVLLSGIGAALIYVFNKGGINALVQF
jgi:uncharacterized protein involved in exopolysaccharide biosynthesis